MAVFLVMTFNLAKQNTIIREWRDDYWLDPLTFKRISFGGWGKIMQNCRARISKANI
jgi:hypothetical protein